MEFLLHFTTASLDLTITETSRLSSFLVTLRGGYSLVAVLGLLIVVASLVAEHGLCKAVFNSCGAWA